MQYCPTEIASGSACAISAVDPGRPAAPHHPRDDLPVAGHVQPDRRPEDQRVGDAQVGAGLGPADRELRRVRGADRQDQADPAVAVFVQVVHGHLEAQRVVAAHPLERSAGRGPAGRLPLDQDGGHRQAVDPVDQPGRAGPVQARRQQQALHLLRLDEPADLAAVLGRVVAGAAQLDVHAEGGRGGPRPGHHRRPVVVQRRHHHADREAGGGRARASLRGRQLGGQGGAAVHPGEQVALGQDRDVPAHGELADAEHRREVPHPHGAVPAQLRHEPLLALQAEQPLARDVLPVS